MKVLLTGSSGFLGRYVYKSLLQKKNITVHTLGRSTNCDFVISLTDKASLDKIDISVYDVVIHLAGMAHVFHNSKMEKQMFDINNYVATKNLCDRLEINLNKTLLFFFTSSVSVYGIDYGINISEDIELIPQTPAAISKKKAEEYLQTWAKKNSVNLLIFRLPLVVGSNPPGNLGKMISAIKRGTYLSIGGGKARKSMVLADDIAKLFADFPTVSGIYNLTDGYHPTFEELESVICQQLKRPKPFNLSWKIASLIGKIGDIFPKSPINSKTIAKITHDLTFSDLKARKDLGWNPSKVIDNWRL